MTTQNSAPRPPRALIAMSGGVDSSVAAWLMQRDGYDCTGITMRLTHNEMLGQSGFHTCCSEKDIEDAAEVAFALDIPYEVLDFTADFREQIIEKFVRVYEAGGTPNPCIDCNQPSVELDAGPRHGICGHRPLCPGGTGPGHRPLAAQKGAG